jgi:hypothetical protein
LLKDWGEEQAVVFHPATNSTHLVNAPAAAVLAVLLLDEGAAGGTWPAPDAAPDEHALPAILDALSQVGLIRRIAD